MQDNFHIHMQLYSQWDLWKIKWIECHFTKVFPYTYDVSDAYYTTEMTNKWRALEFGGGLKWKWDKLKVNKK
jgi:hypothetical protein